MHRMDGKELDEPDRDSSTAGAARPRVAVIALGSAVDLMDVLDPVAGLFPSAVFRGQSNASWGLVPSAFRENVPLARAATSFPRSHEEQVALEFDLLASFVRLANESGFALPGDNDALRARLVAMGSQAFWKTDAGVRSWPPQDLLPSIALAQHSGVPTRLLDWTYSGYIAAYFAAEGCATRQNAGNFCVWACLPSRRLGRVAYAPSVELVRPSNAFNRNLHAQKGCLMVWRHGRPLHVRPSDVGDLTGVVWGTEPYPQPLLPQPMESVTLDEILSIEADRSGVSSAAPIFYKITLPQPEARTVLELLRFRHVDASTLFPSWEGIARAVRERMFQCDRSDLFEVNRRRAVLHDRVFSSLSEEWRNSTVGETALDPSEQLDTILSASRRALLAGDYDPDLAERIEAFEELLSQQIGSAYEQEIRVLLRLMRAQAADG